MNNDKFKKIRLSTGLTQKQFADELGVSSKLVESIEQGRRKVMPRTERSILELLPRIDSKKGLAKENPTCPFCGQTFSIKEVSQHMYKIDRHNCTSGSIRIESSILTKSLLLRALTPVPKAALAINNDEER